MSCVSFWSGPDGGRAWLQRLRAAAEDPRPVSTFRSPDVSDAKVARIRQLAASTDPKIRESAALSQLATGDLLDKLSHDDEVGVRCCVARNQRTPLAVLLRLAHDGNAGVRAWVAANPSARELLDDLQHDTSETVRLVAAWATRW